MRVRIPTFILIWIFIEIPFLPAQIHIERNLFDQFVFCAVTLSERSLYGTNFNDAEKYLQVSFFRDFKQYHPKHQIMIVTHLARVRLVKNTLHQSMGELNHVLYDLLAHLPMARKLEVREVYGQYLSALAMAYLYNSKLDSAGYFYNQALNVFRQTDESYSSADARAFQILVTLQKLRRSGDSEKIVSLIPLFEKEIEFSGKAENKMALAYNLRHLATIYSNQKINFLKALELHQQSLALREEVGFEPYIPASYSSLGDVQYALGNMKEAIHMYMKSIELAEKVGFVRYQFHPRMKIGDIYLKQGEFTKSKVFYMKGLKNASVNQYLDGIDEALKKLECLDY